MNTQKVVDNFVHFVLVCTGGIVVLSWESRQKKKVRTCNLACSSAAQFVMSCFHVHYGNIMNYFTGVEWRRKDTRYYDGNRQISSWIS